MLIAVNYHYIRPHFPADGIHGITPDQFEQQLALLGRCGEFVDSVRVRAAVLGETELPRQSILITFDDGLREQYEHAWPVLQRRGIPAMFFVNTRPIAEQSVCLVHKIHFLRSQIAPARFVDLLRRHAVEDGLELKLDADAAARNQYPFDGPQAARLKYFLNFVLARRQRERLITACFREVFQEAERKMSRRLYMIPAQIQELGRTKSVGTHGHDHKPLGQLDLPGIRQAIQASLDFLQALLGYRPFALSYPYGSRQACSPDAARAARALGLDYAFTMERAGNVAALDVLPAVLARYADGSLTPWPQNLSLGRVFRRRDFNAGAVRRMRSNFQSGMMAAYLADFPRRTGRYPIREAGIPQAL
jgi:peptidoglycan/xylan/chitin deacetylase (PgdA/CDA1 family)